MKFCKNCGTELDDNDKFCKACGSKVEENNFNEEKIEVVDAEVEMPMYIECKLCGAKVESSETNCPVCGSLLDKTNYAKPKQVKQASGEKTKNGLATAGFIVSIVAFALGGGWPGIIIGIPGLVMALIGLIQISKGKGTNKVMAIIGVAVGAYAIVMGIVYVVWLGAIIEEYLNQLEEALEGMMEETFVNLIRMLFIR